eukprot:6214225-Pleurochrysis_carterae.AAC.4
MHHKRSKSSSNKLSGMTLNHAKKLPIASFTPVARLQRCVWGRRQAFEAEYLKAERPLCSLQHLLGRLAALNAVDSHDHVAWSHPCLVGLGPRGHLRHK